MIKTDLKQVAKTTLTGDEIVSSHTDPDFYGSLEMLPNPDAILRRIGKADEVYQAISQDPHVSGEIRSSRAGLLKFETKLLSGGESVADKKAHTLCQQVLATKPAPNMIWADVFWNMSKAQYLGFVVHEIIWQQVGHYVLPVKLLDRKNKRFVFSGGGDLLLKVKGQNKAIMIDENRVLLTRHQPSAQNPYGVALFSSCFWSYTFKHAGFRSYTKFINKYGLPWAIGKYPPGTSQKEIDTLVMALQKMVEEAVAGIPEGASVQLLEPKGGKNAPQEAFINLCNREMSKALTSQTMATEQSQNGSRAAGQVAREREESVDTSQRVIVEATINKLLRLITQVNVAGANPPTFHFFEKNQAPMKWVEALEKAAGFMDISKEYAHFVTGIPMAKDSADTLQTVAQFSRESDSTDFYGQHDKQMQAIYHALSAADNLTEFQHALDNLAWDDDINQALALPILDEMIKGRGSV